jgi:Flp pilus assembly protein TadD
MIGATMAKLKCTISFLIACIVCLICLSGCSESAKSEKNKNVTPDYSNLKFDEVSKPEPTATTLYVIANILASQGKVIECEAVMKRIIQEYPEFFPVYNSLAELQLRQGRKKEAIHTMRSGLAFRPEDATLLNNIGMCQLICMEYESALEMFTKAAGVMPKNPKYRANMAATLSLMGHYEQSLALFSQVLSKEDADYNVNAIRKAKVGKAPFLHGIDFRQVDNL